MVLKEVRYLIFVIIYYPQAREMFTFQELVVEENHGFQQTSQYHWLFTH